MAKLKNCTSSIEDTKRKLLKMEKNKIQQNALSSEYSEMQKIVMAEMNELGVDEVIVEAETPGGKVLSGLIYNKVNIKYDEQKLKSALNKEQYKAVTNRFLIADEQKLKAILKKYPNLRNELKDAITANYILDYKKLDIAFENGLFTVKDIEGCYSKDITKVFKLQRKKGEA